MRSSGSSADDTGGGHGINYLAGKGDKDANAPLPLTGVETSKLISSRLVVYEGAPRGIVLTHRERFLSDVATFIAS